MDKEKLYSGLSKCAWGYFFLYFDFNINTVSILPGFWGFWLFLKAISLLGEEERELKLLEPLGGLLFAWNLINWCASWFGASMEGRIPGLNVIVCIAGLYFHFQLLTNLASIARRYQPEETEHDKQLLACRTMQTVLLTVMMVLSQMASLFGDAWAYISIGLGIIYLIAGVRIIAALFSMRKCFAE